MLCVLADISKDRPVLQVAGPTGCGKTTLLRKMGRTIVSPAFNVIPLSEDPKEFENILVNNELAFFDNVDYVHPKIKSLICQASTGILIKRRELFTTTGEISVMSKATLGFSSLTDILSTGEQANRAIQIRLLERLDGTYISETALMEQFGKKRTALLSEILVRANMVLEALEAQASYVPRVKSRLADFASIILKVARHEGWHALALEILEAWDADQHDAALNNDDLSEALTKWMSQSDWKPRTMFAGELNDALRSLGYGSDSSWKSSPRALSTKLDKTQASYKLRFGLVIDIDKHTKTSTFTFNPPEKAKSEAVEPIADTAVILAPAAPVTVDAAGAAAPGAEPDNDYVETTLGLMPRWALREEERCS
jgi:hypothetical protein